MKRILLVDGSIHIQNETKEALGAGFELSLASTLAEARGFLGRDLFDLIVLEAELADGTGCDFCGELRKKEITADIPVIFLTEKSNVPDKVRAFSLGADDYIVKPVESLELIARIEARLRKANVSRDQEPSLLKGDLTLIVPFQKAVLREGGAEKDLKLTPTEFRLLYFFIKNEGVVLSRSQLLSIIWSEDVHVLTRTIDKHISTLKKKLASRAGYIQSVHSRGYRFSPVVPSTVRENESSMEISSDV
jgi:two-component system phosphate regulon response regulator PhoB